LREAASSGALVTIAVGSSSTRVGGFVRAVIDIHKAVFPAAVLDPASGDISKERFKASRKAPVAWIENWDANLDVVAIEATIGWRWVAIEATIGWRWVARELRGRGIEVRFTDARQASALQGYPEAPEERPPGRALAGHAAGARAAARGAAGAGKTSSGCGTRPGCVRRWPTIKRAGRSACTPCPYTRAGRARAGRC
jgi:hypothetical protein